MLEDQFKIKIQKFQDVVNVNILLFKSKSVKYKNLWSWLRVKTCNWVVVGSNTGTE